MTPAKFRNYETRIHFYHTLVPEVHFSFYTAVLPVLSDVLALCSRSIRALWRYKRRVADDQAFSEMSAFSSGRV
ncbi:hypothetical protein SIN01_18730 [Sporolactobacillus inulinus]|jgi:hypothetical protein|nr:hypothetical protein SIN01_18730 [Sporolactobacillus inulinus]